MYDFDQINRQLDEENAALEAMIAEFDENDDPAMEALLADGTTADSMLENIRATVDEKCKSEEDCDKFLEGLEKEIEKFNDAVGTFKEAAIDMKDGKIDAAGLKERIAPAVASLKKSCNMINVDVIDADTDKITDDEIKTLKAFLEGAREILNEKKENMSNASECGTCESFFNMIDDLETYEAMEADTLAIEDKQSAQKKNIAYYLKKLKDTVIGLIKRAIERIQGFIKKDKAKNDGKNVSKFQEFINKLKSLFKKSDNCKSEEDVEEIRVTADDIVTDSNELANAVYIANAAESFCDHPDYKYAEAAIEACRTIRFEIANDIIFA